jgi:hypothetical protein
VRRPTPEQLEATRNECALTVARHEKAQNFIFVMNETVLVTQAAIEHSRDLMAWADAVLKGRV